VSLKLTDKNFKQPNCFWLSMHAYRILLPSENDDSRFNSREKHMLTDSVQPYNKPIIDLACSVCKKKPRSDISQYRPHARSISRYYYIPDISYSAIWLVRYTSRIFIIYRPGGSGIRRNISRSDDIFRGALPRRKYHHWGKYRRTPRAEGL
jgi:hypothetical protein